jgi:hypothetical protein
LYSGLAPYYLLSAKNHLPLAGFYFICLQATLSYVTAGIAKAISPAWRSGKALPAVINTATYGNRGFSTLLAKRTEISGILCWAVILFECAFPIALIAPRWLLISLLIMGLGFHISNAVMMGLNVFVWSFLGTYPAIFLVNAHIRRMIPWI